MLVATVLGTGCSGGSAAPSTSVVPKIFSGTTVASTTPLATISVGPNATLATTTTVATEAWPEGAPKIDLFEPDHYKRTEQLEAFIAWRGQDSTREPTFSLYTKPGSPADDLAKKNLDLKLQHPETNDCRPIVDSVTPWSATDDGTVWIQVTTSSPACSGILDGKPATRAFVPLDARYWHWEEQSGGKWLITERLDSDTLLDP
jgi:hypothetical protein